MQQRNRKTISNDGCMHSNLPCDRAATILFAAPLTGSLCVRHWVMLGCSASSSKWIWKAHTEKQEAKPRHITNKNKVRSTPQKQGHSKFRGGRVSSRWAGEAPQGKWRRTVLEDGRGVRPLLLRPVGELPCSAEHKHGDDAVPVLLAAQLGHVVDHLELDVLGLVVEAGFGDGQHALLRHSLLHAVVLAALETGHKCAQTHAHTGTDGSPGERRKRRAAAN